MASSNDIADVREVIYDGGLRRQLKQHLRSISVQMGLEGEGPTWVYPTGGVTVGVRDSADRCDKIAALMEKTGDRLADLDINRSDKGHLRDGFEQLAKAWKKRADIWRQPSAPDVDRAVSVITDHERGALREFRRVKEYFRGGDEEGP